MAGLFPFNSTLSKRNDQSNHSLQDKKNFLNEIGDLADEL